jgi:nucleolar protein 15
LSDQSTDKNDGIVTAAAAVSKKGSANSKKNNSLKHESDVKTSLPTTKVPKAEKVLEKIGTKSSKKSAPEPIETNDEDASEDDAVVDEVSDDDDLEEDDQTLALIQGFESDGDEEDAGKAGDLGDNQDPPTLPTGAPAMSKKQQKKLKQLAESGTTEEPGVVYIGRLPHGFYEHEMKAYFSQFGNILRLRLSRNKKTGASKHFAFIEFESATVAEIVAKTMDNYLMFNHILKVKLVPAAQVHADLFKGANKRFKKVPWNKIQGRKLDQAAPEEAWDKRIEREEQRREEKADKLKAIGYEFKASKVKTTKQITKKDKPLIALAAEEQANTPKVIDSVPAVDVSSAGIKKSKKAKAAKSTTSTEEVTPEEPKVSNEIESAPSAKLSNKSKKGKKSKATEDTTTESVPAINNEPVEQARKHEEVDEAVATEVIGDLPAKKLRTKSSRASMTNVSGPSSEKTKKDKKSKK